jgi:hypothetical protein
METEGSLTEMPVGHPLQSLPLADESATLWVAGAGIAGDKLNEDVSDRARIVYRKRTECVLFNVTG